MYIHILRIPFDSRGGTEAQAFPTSHPLHTPQLGSGTSLVFLHSLDPPTVRHTMTGDEIIGIIGRLCGRGPPLWRAGPPTSPANGRLPTNSCSHWWLLT